MASLFRARRRRSPEDDGGEEDGSGSGRAKRRRVSPEEGALSLAEAGLAAEGSSPGWLSTFVSGAKRVISSVLFSSQEETASGEEEQQEEEEGDGQEDSDENEDAHDAHGAIVSYSESKLAIEEMVLKETFSRDECDKMVKLIQSRVTDSTFPEANEYGTPKEIPRRNAGAGHDFTGAWRSLNWDRNFPESAPFSSTGPGSFSPGSPLQASPELCNAAVMEAKKWLEKKKQGVGSKPEDQGLCTLNTDMLNSDFEFDKGSPVDLAKSYMQSLPPWQSPLLGSQKLKTPLSGGVHMNDGEGKSKYFSSSKVTTKEDYLSNFWENLEESRRAHIRSSGTSLDASKFRHYGSTSRLFDNDFSVFSSGTREEVGEAAQSYKGSDKVAAAEPANGCSLPIAPTKDGNDGVVDSVDPAKDNGNLVQECHAASETHPVIPQICEYPGLISSWDGMCGADEVAQGNHMPPTSVTKEGADHSGYVKAPAAEPEIREESHLNSTSELGPEDAGPQIQTSLRSLKKKVQTSLKGSTNKTSANGLLDRSDGNSGLESSGNDNPSCTNSSSAVPPISNDFINSTADAADGNSVDNGARVDSEKLVDGNSVNNGATMDSEKLVEAPNPKPSYVRRGRKRVVRSTRGRGK